MDRDSIAAFYQLAREMTAIERDRFEQAEGKAWRHLYVLIVLLGLAFASSGRRALEVLDGTVALLEWGFIAVFGLFLTAAFGAGLVSVWNFSVFLTLEPPADRSIEQFALAVPVDRFHLKLGREFMRAAAENRQVADSKYRLIKWNFRLLVLAITLGLVLGVLYSLLSRGSDA